MIERNQQAHDAEIVDQFTKQAIPFAQSASALDPIQMLIELSKVAADDVVLDVACGPGLVACEFAKVARHVTGIDLTEKMIELAKERQKELGLGNLSWDIGSAYPLPFDTASFSVVVTRYSFHHFLDPKEALGEMIRVCRPNGIVLVADIALPPEKVDAYNRVERLRDPSHIQAYSYGAWEKIFRESGLRNLQRGSHRLELPLDELLKGSFPHPGDDEKIREIFRKDIGVDSLGMDAHLVGAEIHMSFPTSVYVGNK